VSAMAPKAASLRRWWAAVVASVVAILAFGPIAVFHLNAHRSGARLVADVMARLGEIDPPGSDDPFPECFGSLIASTPKPPGSTGPPRRFDNICLQYELGKRLPRSDMPASCRLELDALLPWSADALACADAGTSKPRMLALGLTTRGQHEAVWGSMLILSQGTRHAIAQARDENRPEAALDWCDRVLHLGRRFEHLDWASLFWIERPLAGDCAWAAERAGPAHRARLHQTTSRILSERPTNEHAVEDHFLWARMAIYGGYASSNQLDELPPHLRRLFGIEEVLPDDFPRTRQVLARIGWLIFDRGAAELASHANEPAGDFENRARRLENDRLLNNLGSSSSQLGNMPNALPAWQRRWQAIEKLQKISGGAGCVGGNCNQ
jgi:hypothetical protein